MKHSIRPRWWLLEILMALMMGLLLVEARTPLTPGWHKAASFIIVVILFGLTAIWVHVNRAALALWEQPDDDRPLRRTYLRNETPADQTTTAEQQRTARQG